MLQYHNHFIIIIINPDATKMSMIISACATKRCTTSYSVQCIPLKNVCVPNALVRSNPCFSMTPFIHNQALFHVKMIDQPHLLSSVDASSLNLHFRHLTNFHLKTSPLDHFEGFKISRLCSWVFDDMQRGRCPS